MRADQRTEERVAANLKVNTAVGPGITRDVSASGLYFEINAAVAAGHTIDFSVDLDLPGGRLALVCTAQVLRVEPAGERQGVAVRILQSVLRERPPARATA
jgi:hypothetical protein